MPLKIKRHPLLATHSVLAVTAFLGSVSKHQVKQVELTRLAIARHRTVRLDLLSW